MPNHFHLFVEQKTMEGLKAFMKALATNYAVYFNRKYDRIGPLFQGTYKAVLIQSEPYLKHITRYIHTNPIKLLARDYPLQKYYPLQRYPYSSYAVYLGGKECEWVKKEDILAMFGENIGRRARLYKQFVEDDLDGGGSQEILGELALE